MLLSDILGNKDLLEGFHLIKKNNVIHHAHVFYGPSGNEKFKLTLAFAQFINCKDSINDSCGTCFSCSQISKLQHPDLISIFPIINEGNKTNNDFLKDWRGFILDNPYANITMWAEYLDSKNKLFNISKKENKTISSFTSIKPYDNKYKVVLMWLCEYMHISTSNSLLKLIEDPPPNTIFLFITEAIDLLPKTLVSRFITHYIPPIKYTDIQNSLKKQFDYTDDLINSAAICCEGNMNKAYEILTNNYIEEYDRFQQWMRACYKNNLISINHIAEDLLKYNKENQKNFLIFSIEIFRNVLLKGLDLELFTFPIGNDIFIKKFSNQLSLLYLAQIFYFIEETIFVIDRNANFKLAFIDLSIKISKCFDSN